MKYIGNIDVGYQIVDNCQKTGIKGITDSEIFVQYQPILADTDTMNSQNETIQLFLENIGST